MLSISTPQQVSHAAQPHGGGHTGTCMQPKTHALQPCNICMHPRMPTWPPMVLTQVHARSHHSTNQHRMALIELQQRTPRPLPKHITKALAASNVGHHAPSISAPASSTAVACGHLHSVCTTRPTLCLP
eukprot:CAMPEP_0202869252 /NCGR_PEP_ID=MMETSP1391-20130828/12266_1 /ASSEMBLY_ACC=CAM_ASM_000867 /TAXON_ID=1034604 /ORGANISM="Chlamydomonas leiostraca, Strain SAG 11-49" /LENGTH=128 /DNA_ID=CAMNT_0049549547 /DNA_START=263 /DNA_END=645 /DNA_ORIENTATION=-